MLATAVAAGVELDVAPAVAGVAPAVAGVVADVTAPGRGRATSGRSETTAMVELDGSRRSLSPLTSKEMLHVGVEGLRVQNKGSDSALLAAQVQGAHISG